MSASLYVKAWRLQWSVMWEQPTSWRDLVRPFADGGIHKHHSAFRIGWLGFWMRGQYTPPNHPLTGEA